MVVLVLVVVAVAVETMGGAVVRGAVAVAVVLRP